MNSTILPTMNSFILDNLTFQDIITNPFFYGSSIIFIILLFCVIFFIIILKINIRKWLF